VYINFLKSIDFHVCGRSNVRECSRVCEVSFGVADLHVDELLVCVNWSYVTSRNI